MQQKLQEVFQPILGLPLTRTTRNGLVQYFHFGSTHYTTSQGLVLDVGEYTLALDCLWQLQLPGGEPIKHEQVYQRKVEAGLPDPGFNWKTPGANLRDQRLKELLQTATSFAPETVEAVADLSFRLHFTNGAVLSVTPNPDQKQEVYWQFFSNKGDNFEIKAGAAGLNL